MIFSATHLMMRGLTGYVSDMSSELSRLDRIFRGGLLSLPGIPVLLGGCGESTVTMEIVEFGNWMKTTGEPYPAQTWETFLSGILSDQMGGTFRQNPSKIPLPDKLRNPQVEKSWKTGGWTSPCGVRPVTVDMETTVGAQSIACAQSIAPSLIGDNICEKNLKFLKNYIYRR